MDLIAVVAPGSGGVHVIDDQPDARQAGAVLLYGAAPCGLEPLGGWLVCGGPSEPIPFEQAAVASGVPCLQCWQAVGQTPDPAT